MAVHSKIIFVNSNGDFEEASSADNVQFTAFQTASYSLTDALLGVLVNLGAVTNGDGASTVGIEDASSYYTGTNVEAAFNELEAQLGGLTSGTFGFTEDNVLVDNDAVYAALDKLDLKWGDLGSVINGEGASIVGVEDSAANFTATNVEGVLAELQTKITAVDNSGVSYTVGTGGVTKGDLLAISANDTVLPLVLATQGLEGIGLAATTELAAASVKAVANDSILAGVLTTATAGNRYYWDGSALSTTISGVSGSHVWKCGVAKNASDLHVQIQFIKRNA